MFQSAAIGVSFGTTRNVEISKQRIYQSIGFADHATPDKSSRRKFVMHFYPLIVFKIKAVDFNVTQY